MVLIGYWDSLIAARLPDKSGSVASYQEAPDKIAVVASDSQDYTRPRSKGIYLLPNLLTTGCLFSGFYAVDRKSTRLNSSHSQISYAVFCLKKKKLDEFTSN